MYEPKWDQPNPSDLQTVSEPPLPDTETLLAEMHSSYPAVTYPAPQEPSEHEDGDQEDVDQTIFAGLVWP
jgi:hypothetical protein